jgi:hypothetical protein
MGVAAVELLTSTMSNAYLFTPLIQGTSQSVVIAGTGLSTPDAQVLSHEVFRMRWL